MIPRDNFPKHSNIKNGSTGAKVREDLELQPKAKTPDMNVDVARYATDEEVASARIKSFEATLAAEEKHLLGLEPTASEVEVDAAREKSRADRMEAARAAQVRKDYG